jgi:hypothetical protein
MAKRVGIIVIVVALVAVMAMAFSPARVIIANVDGPPVSVEIVGFTHVSVGCPGAQTIWVPLLRIMPRDVVVTDTRTGSVLRKVSVLQDTVVLIRGTTVLTGEPGASYGPAPINGCP